MAKSGVIGGLTVVTDSLLTFVTGFFGQNFGWLTGHITTLAEFVIYGIGALAVSLAVLLSWLRLRRSGPASVS